jgi:hypothetical protein
MSSLNWSLKNASGYVLLSNIYTAGGVRMLNNNERKDM